MKVDFDKFAGSVMAMKEAKTSDIQSEYRELIGILTGNKTCLENVSLESLSYYIENMDTALGSGRCMHDFDKYFYKMIQARPKIHRGI